MTTEFAEILQNAGGMAIAITVLIFVLKYMMKEMEKRDQMIEKIFDKSNEGYEAMRKSLEELTAIIKGRNQI